MNRIEDERVLFYLRHQERIDEWAALAKDASELADQFLRSCERDISGVAAEFDADVRTFVSLNEPYPKLFLCRADWFPQTDDKEVPRAGIGIEWQRSAVTFAGRGKTAYVGTWVQFQMPGGAALQNSVSRAIREAGLVKEHQLETARIWWPAYRWETAKGEYWNDLSSYRSQLVDSLRFFWRTFEPIVSASLRA